MAAAAAAAAVVEGKRRPLVGLSVRGALM